MSNRRTIAKTPSLIHLLSPSRATAGRLVDAKVQRTQETRLHQNSDRVMIAAMVRRSSGLPLTEDHPVKPFAAGNDLPYQPKPMKTPVPDGVNWFREALPVEIKILSGSMILGSDATPMVLIGDFKRAEGVLSVSDVSSLAAHAQ